MLILITSMAGQPEYVGVMVIKGLSLPFNSTLRIMPRSNTLKTGTSGSCTSSSSFQMDDMVVSVFNRES